MRSLGPPSGQRIEVTSFAIYTDKGSVSCLCRDIGNRIVYGSTKFSPYDLCFRRLELATVPLDAPNAGLLMPT